MKRLSVSRDDISSCIIQALAVKGLVTFSAHSYQVEAMRGKAPRGIIRARLKNLKRDGKVREVEGSGAIHKLIK